MCSGAPGDARVHLLNFGRPDLGSKSKFGDVCSCLKKNKEDSSTRGLHLNDATELAREIVANAKASATLVFNTGKFVKYHFYIARGFMNHWYCLV